MCWHYISSASPQAALLASAWLRRCRRTQRCNWCWCRASIDTFWHRQDAKLYLYNSSARIPELSSEGHGMGGWTPATQADALQRMRDFLRIHLKPWDFTDNPHGDLTAY